MRHFLLSVAAMGILFGVTASAQQYGQPYYQYRNGRGYYSGRNIIAQSMADLDRIGAFGRYDRHDRKHVEHARHELMKFQEKWARGRFDSHPLDEAIDEMKGLARSRRVDPRESSMLMRDVEGLREFRANRGYYRGDRDDRYRDGYYRRDSDDGYRR